MVVIRVVNSVFIWHLSIYQSKDLWYFMCFSLNLKSKHISDLFSPQPTLCNIYYQVCLEREHYITSASSWLFSSVLWPGHKTAELEKAIILFGKDQCTEVFTWVVFYSTKNVCSLLSCTVLTRFTVKFIFYGASKLCCVIAVIQSLLNCDDSLLLFLQ